MSNPIKKLKHYNMRLTTVLNELSDMVSTMKALEFGINWIRNYIPLLREVVRCKQ